MVGLAELWLPIAVATLLVLIASIALWKFFPHHQGEGGPRPLASGALGGQLVYILAVTLVVAYLAGRTLEPGAEYFAVFRVAGTAGILAYAAALFPDAIWGSSTWSATLRRAADGVIYGLLTAGSFGGFWPGG